MSAARLLSSTAAASPCRESEDLLRSLTDRNANLSAGLPLQAVLVSIAIHALWGGNPVAVKLGLEMFPPMWTAFVRFSIATLCVAAWAAYRGIALWPKREYWPVLALVSAAFTIQIGVMNFGFSLASGTVSAVLQSTNPLFVALFAHYLLARDRIGRRGIAGLLIAFTGAAVVLLRNVGDGGELGLIGLGGILVLVSAMLLGLRLVLMVKPLRNIGEIPVVFWMMVLSLFPFGICGALFETIRWENFGWVPVAGLLYQGMVIAGLGFMVFSFLMRRYSPSVVASFNFVSPISGVFLSVILLGESVTVSIVAGVMLVGTGLYLAAGSRRG